MSTGTSILPPQQTAIQHGRLVEYLCMAWMLVEAAVGIGSGIVAGSIALVGFGADSVIELFSSGVLIWRLREGTLGQQREHTALKLVGISFFALATYVSFDAVQDLALGHRPQPSYIGIGLAAAALVIMPLRARAKRRDDPTQMHTRVRERSISANNIGRKMRRALIANQRNREN